MFEPWDKQFAHRAALILVGVGAAIMLTDAIATTAPGELAATVSYVLPALFFALIAAWAAIGPRLPALFYTVLPLSGSAGLAVLSVSNSDATAATQLFFWLPLLYAATQLRPAGAYLALAVDLIADAAVVYPQLPNGEATRDLCYATAIFSATTFFLVQGQKAQRRLTDILRHQAAVDALTGLVNRRVLDEAAHSALASAVGDVGTALILVDIDNFKTINDTYGHPVGDRALTHIANVIAANTRKDSVISRIGGDELAVLLPSCPPDVAIRRAEQIVAAVSSTPLIGDDENPIALTVSAGVAHAPATPASDLPHLYASADTGLYNAKRNGRNQVGTPERNHPT